LLDEETLNTAVRRVLRAKFLLRLFDDPYVDPERAEKTCDAAQSRALARQAARECIVLLKNEENALPLRKEIKTLAIIGPNADTAELGDYSGRNKNLVSPLQGIRNKVGHRAKVLYAKGCEILGPKAVEATEIEARYLKSMARMKQKQGKKD
jgi:beta-glucosidase